MNIRIFIGLLFILLYCTISNAQSIDQKHSTYSYALKSLDQFKEFLALPNDAHFPEQIEKNVLWCAGKLEEKGFKTQRLETEGAPLLLADYQKKLKDKPTLLLYIHIDGQPVDPSFWFQENPYQAVLKKQVEGEGWVDMAWERLKEKQLDPNWRIFARSTSDDKAPFIMLLTALETLKAQGKSLPYNFKVILDFEEEIGSPNLSKAVLDYKDLLAADMLIIHDGPKQ